MCVRVCFSFHSPLLSMLFNFLRGYESVSNFSFRFKVKEMQEDFQSFKTGTFSALLFFCVYMYIFFVNPWKVSIKIISSSYILRYFCQPYVCAA